MKVINDTIFSENKLHFQLRLVLFLPEEIEIKRMFPTSLRKCPRAASSMDKSDQFHRLVKET